MDLSPEAAGRPGAPRYAGFWIRVFANVLDVLAIGALNMAAILVATAWLGGRGIGSVSVGISEVALQLGTLWPALAIIAFWIWKGATPGKMMCRLRIVDESTGGRLGTWQCVGRYVVAGIAVGLAGIGYLWIAIDPRKQGWHDKIVRTLVVHRERAA